MTAAGTPPPKRTLQRLAAAIWPSAFAPVLQQSVRMPDLESWSMPHRAVDMRDWELALNMAQNHLQPDRTRLMDLYESILIDSHLASVMESRVLRVARSKFKLVGPNGKAKPELVQLFEQSWFEDFLRYTAEAAFRGHTLIELSELVKPGQLKRITRIDPRNVLPWTGVVVKQMGQTTGYLYREQPYEPYFIELGRPNDLGLLARVAPVAIVKKYAIGSWSDFMGKFGIPPRWVKTGTTDKKRFKQLETMMQNMVSSAYAVLNTDEEIQVMPTPGTDAFRVFDALISRMNSEMSKRVLGQDGTSDNKDATGTYGSLQVLQGVAEDRHQADKASVLYAVNNELFPRLINLGYPLQGIRFQWDEMRELSATELVDAVAKLGLVFDIDPKHVEERVGIRILGARRMPGEVADPNAPAPGNPPGAGKQGGKKADAKKTTEEGGEDDDEEDGATASWPQHDLRFCAVCGGTRDDVTAAAPVLSPEVVEALVAASFEGATWHQPYFEATSKTLVDGLMETWGGQLADVHYSEPDHVARVVMEQNIFRFGQVKTLAAATQLNAMARDSKSLADFRKAVDDSGLLEKYNRTWLETEYINAVNTGIQGSRWFQQQRDADALPYGQYMTQQDGQVRPVHAAMHGRTWAWADPIWNTIYPPNGPRCRCYVAGVANGPSPKEMEQSAREAMGGLESSGELERMKKGGYNTNRAITGQVFDVNRSYMKELDSDDRRKHVTLNVEQSYGRKDMTLADINKRALPQASPGAKDQAAAELWFKAHSTDGVMAAKDPSGRPWVIESGMVKDHLAKDRHATLHLVPEVLAAPDEVWMTSKGGTNARFAFLRYYEGTPMVVRCEVKAPEGGQPGKLRVSSWYVLDEAKEAQVRNGLLLNRMPGDV